MGNLLAIEVKIEGYDILLINIYGPNRDSPEFYEKLQNIIELFCGDFVIISGDLNLVQDSYQDYDNYKHIGNPKSRKIVLEMIEKYNLVDHWRAQHENQKRYTSNKKVEYFFSNFL
jgi:exonuclease III